jgi:hypothetical protein
MPARTELDRLAAARPPLLDRTELVVDRAAEDQILRNILAAAPASGRSRPAASRSARRSRGARHQALRPATAIAAAAAVVAVAGAGVLVRSAMDHVTATARSGAAHRGSAPARLPSLRIMAARAEAAVAAVSRTGILFVRTVYPPGTTTGGIAVMQTWTRGNWDREQLFSAGGGLVDDVSAVIAGNQRVRRFVDYPTRTWQTDSIAVGLLGAGPSASEFAAQMFQPLPAVTAQKLPGGARPDVPRRTITAVKLQGKPMILITFRYPRPFRGTGVGTPESLPLLGGTDELPGSAGRGNSATAKMIWIDETTYLPVRAETATATGIVVGSETYRWLSDSLANRAALAPAPVPASFRRTPELAH